MRHLKKGNIAFWRYDQPGMRFNGGRIEKVSGKNYPGPGHAQIEGYGGAFWMKVTFCLPPKKGERVLKAIVQAGLEHSRRVASATADYNKTLKVVLPRGVKL